MAGNAVIGALRVDLGLDSAQFNRGLAQAQRGLGRFGVQLTLGVETIGRMVGQALRAIPDAIKGAVDSFDDMGKAAQKVGVSVEALSRLNYAASLADVSFDGLQTGLRKLSVNLAAVATGGTGPAATAFAALGISVTDASGQLRASDEVMADVSEAFSHMADGSTKTAMAVALFGKGGADLIPLLNAGRDGLAEMADESDRLGLTISGTASAAAEEFNDDLTRLAGVWQGLVNHLTTQALPMLGYIADAMVGAARDGSVLENFANGLIEVFKIIVTVGVGVGETIKAIGKSFETLFLAMSIAQTGMQNWGLAMEVLQKGFGDIGQSAADSMKFVDGLWKTIDTGPNFDKVGSAPTWSDVLNFGQEEITVDLAEVADGLGGVKDKAKEAWPEIKKLGSAWDDMASTMKSSLSGMASSITKAFITTGDAGKSALEAISSGLDSLADKALDMAFNGIFDLIFGALSAGLTGGSGSVGSGVGNAIGKIGGGFKFANGGSGRIAGVGAPDSRLFMARVTPGESYAFGDDAERSGGDTIINVDARGAQQGVGAEIARALGDFSRHKLPERVAEINRNPYRR